jgi:uncharacterized membrane protein YwzB
MIPTTMFLLMRILLFFVATPFVYRALQALDFAKVFRANSGIQIRLILMMLSVILGYFFIDVLVSLFESVNALF